MTQIIGQAIAQAIGIGFQGTNITVEYLQLSNNQDFISQTPLVLTQETATAPAIIDWVNNLNTYFIEPRYVMLADTEDYQALAWELYLKGKDVRILTNQTYYQYHQELELSPGTDGLPTTLAKIGCLANIPKWRPFSTKIKDIRDLLNQRIPHLNIKSITPKETTEYIAADQALSDILSQINAAVHSDAALLHKVNLLRSIPGVELITAAKIIAETNGFALISSISQLTLYAGYAQETNVPESPGEVTGESGVSHQQGNLAIRGALFHPAQNLRASEDFYQDFYDRLVPKIGEEGAEIGVQRKLLALMYSLWKQNQAYIPLTAYEITMQQLQALRIRLEKAEVGRHQKVMRTAQIDEQIYHINYVESESSTSVSSLQTEQATLSSEITTLSNEIDQILTDIEGLETQRTSHESSVPDVEKINIAIADSLVYHETINRMNILLEETLNYLHQLGDLDESMPEMASAIATLTGEETTLENKLPAFETLLSDQIDDILSIDPSFTQWPVSQVIDLDSLDDEIPIALFPVRVETRFMTLKHVQRVNSPTDNVEAVRDKHELWVRIYPDDLHGATHEEGLTSDEQLAGENYWNEVWDNYGDENHKLGAWRVITGGYGAERSAWIIQQLTPTNIENIGGGQSPDFPSPTIKENAWAEAAYTELLPDNFAVRLYKGTNYREVIGKTIPNSLSIGVFPTDGEDEEAGIYEQVDGRVSLPSEIEWLSNFHEAVDKGMALRIPLWGFEMYEGFDRMIVLGVKTSKDQSESQVLLEKLIDGHHFTGGFSFLPQGTPTNNSPLSKAGYSSYEQGRETSFEIELGDPLFSLQTDSLLKKDGQRFAESFGIKPDRLFHIAHADGEDVKQALAMNQALWPATLGYYLEQMLTPLLTDGEIEQVRDFFIDHVLGRGHIPAFRTGKQPYGVLLTSAFSRWQYQNSYSGVGKQLFSKVLKHLDTAWQALVPSLTYTGNGNSLNGTLANLLSQHATSVNYYQRFTAGQFLLENMFSFAGGSGSPMGNGMPGTSFRDWFRAQGFNFADDPRFFDLAYLFNSRILDGPLIDTAPLSESNLIKPITGTALNYIGWLRQSSLEQIHDENFTNIGAAANLNPPQSLLYLMLRHGVMLGYINGAYLLDPSVPQEQHIQYELQNLNLSEADNFSIEKEIILNKIYKEELRRSTPIVSSSESESESESEPVSAPIERVDDLVAAPSLKWDFLNTSSSLSGGIDFKSYIDTQRLTPANPAPELNLILRQQAALEILEQVSTASLERCFAEHVDLTSYRLDGWMSGLLHERLQANRAKDNKDEGIFLGAYGWLENIRPGGFPGIEVVEIPNPSLSGNGQGFKYLGGPSNGELEEDSETGNIVVAPRVNVQNQGFIHAPSLTHAATAAVLRNGYLSHKQVDGANPLAVNLTSDRIRKALFFLEGIRNGQGLGELLGYQLERAMHEGFAESGLLSMDPLILEVRAKFPLVAGSVVPGESFDEGGDGAEDIQAEEARQVIDGLALMEAFRIDKSGWASGLSFEGDSAVMSFFEKQIGSMINHIDAIADLTMTESIFQMVQGNHDRAAGILESFNGRGGSLQEPEVIKTPRRGHSLTHRVAIQFDSTGTQKWPSSHSLRSLSEPGLNGWLTSMLPESTHIKVSVSYYVYDEPTDTQTHIEESISMSTLGIQPIDLLYMIGQSGEGADSSQLAESIKFFSKSTLAQQDAQPVTLNFYNRDSFDSTDWTLGELFPLIKELSEMISGARTLKPDDLILPSQSPNAGDAGDAFILSELVTRVEGVFGTLSPLPSELIDNNFKSIVVELNGAIDIAKSIEMTAFDQPGNDAYNAGVSASQNLRVSIEKASGFGLEGSFPVNGFDDNWDNLQALLVQAERIFADMQSRENKIDLLLITIAHPTATNLEKIEHLEEITQLMFGRAFKVFPCFSLLNESDHLGALSRTDLLAEGDDFAVVEWLQGVAKVRPKISQYQRISMLSELITETEFPEDPNAVERISVTQFPLDEDGNDRWLGIQFPEDYEIPSEILSLVIERPSTYAPSANQCGMLLDEWVESIPEKTTTTGIATHYDQPNSEPPQTVLLAITPQETGSWKWDDLMQTVYESLDMAKKRAVDPEILKATSYPQVFPAIIYAISSGDDAPSLDLAKNVAVVPPGDNGPVPVEDSASNQGNENSTN